MKKFLLLTGAALLTGATALAQGVYQIPNSDFNKEWVLENEPGNGWNSFASATGRFATFGSTSPSPIKEKGRSGAEGDYSVKIYSKNLLIAKANGNLTTGIINMGNFKPEDPSNHNFTKRDATTHSLRFAGRPDAVEFYAKFKSGGSPNGRGQFILHGDVDYKDPEVAEQKEFRVGIASVLVHECEEWTRFSGEFAYDQETTPDVQYMLASFTTNPTPGGSQDDSLWIDDVKLIYYHALSALSYGEAKIDFNEATTHYDLSNEYYYADKLDYIKKGQAAKVTTSFDEATAVLTIRVEGEDFNADTNPESVTVYTVQFCKMLNSVLTSALFNKENVKPEEGKTVAVDHIYDAEAFTLACKDDSEATIARVFDEETGLLTVTVTGSDVNYYKDNVHTYQFQFNLPLNSVLSSVAYEEEPYAITEDHLVLVQHVYDADKFVVACEADPEANIKMDYDKETGLLTVTVTGSDVDENPTNVHTYRYQFDLPKESQLTGVNFGGTEIEFSETETTTVEGCYDPEAFTVDCEADPEATIEYDYDDETSILTVTVTGSDVAENPGNVHTYKFQFTVPVGISQLLATTPCDVYTLSGTLVRKNATTLAGLPKGIYVVAGKKVIVK